MDCFAALAMTVRIILVSHHHHDRVFDQPPECPDQLGAERAINGAMIAGQRHAQMCAASTFPFRTTARSSLAPTARIVDCGGLMTAVKWLMPNMPRLETDDVPP